jgi:hypothetical protein
MATMAPVCRFCLSEDHPKNNKMITPCACTGSIRYLHLECLHEWRRLSSNEEYKDKCSICQHYYDLPRRWPLEKVDDPGILWGDFLSNPIITSAFTYYVHIFLHGFVPPLANLGDRIAITFLYQTPLSKLLFFLILFGMTGLYGLYFLPRYRRLRSPRILWRFLAPDVALFVTIQCFFLYLVSIAIFPFGVLYLVGLSYTRGIYIKALEQMNEKGQI